MKPSAQAIAVKPLRPMTRWIFLNCNTLETYREQCQCACPTSKQCGNTSTRSDYCFRPCYPVFPKMRAVVVMSRPQVGAAEVDSPAAALRELGCEVVPVGYDLDDLPDDLEHIRPAVVVVDAGPYLEVGRAVVKHAKQIPTLAEVPILLCIA